MKYPQYVIDYAIDNKISLKEAHRHFILNGKEFKADQKEEPKVEFDIADSRIPQEVIDEIFLSEYGRTLNLNILQSRMKDLQKWYVDEGYSLARITGPSRVTANGVVQLKVIEGSVAGVEVQFLSKEGDSFDENGNKIRGKTKPWVVKREISIKPGETFNRNQLESDIKRLYGT